MHAFGLTSSVARLRLYLQLMLETLFLRSREQGAALLGAQQSVRQAQTCPYRLLAVQECLCCINCPGQPVRQECVLQLHSLAVENAALRQSLSQHEHKSQLDIQDLRKLCLANQDKFNYLDHGLLGDLQQQHQGQQDRIAALEHEVRDCHASTQQIQNKLLQVCAMVHVCAVFAVSTYYSPLSEC